MASVEGIPACLFAEPKVTQPPHLEGDPALATEILPGPPPLSSIQAGGLAKKDHKKAPVAVSYLPQTDPGTTYVGPNAVGTVATVPEVDGPRRKRARLDKGSASSRAQRASARNMTGSASASAPLSDPLAPAETVASTSTLTADPDPASMQVDSDDASLSRSNSVQLGEEGEEISSVRRSSLRRDLKGKGKERATQVKIKDEPTTVSLSLHDTSFSNQTSNEDHCSACRSLGALVYCDGCPRAYHLWCVNPPMDAKDVPAGDERWFCNACILKEKPPMKPPASLKFMAPLIEQVQLALPSEFQIPQDIRTFFKDVATGPKGNYVDSSEVKVPRLNRHGQLEDRDPYRLKDRNGDPVLCHRCGTSALPPDVAAAGPATKRARRAASSHATQDAASGRRIISCDYCHLHWHLDCVDPPMAYLPPWDKRWMCPNHADQILQPKRRIPKANAPPIEITKPGEFNNGNIEVIQPETPTAPPPKMAVDEVLINGRRFRVPERVITMDFWNKTGKGRPHREDEHPSSALSSPLTSLSSVDPMDEDDIDDIVPRLTPQDQSLRFDLEQIKAALALCGMHSGSVQSEPRKPPALVIPPSNKTGPSKSKVSTSSTTGSKAVAPEPPVGPSVNGDAQAESNLRRSGRAGTRRLRPWNKTDMDISMDDLSEDSKDYVPPSDPSRRQKRGTQAKSASKSEGKASKTITSPTTVSVPAPAAPQPEAVAETPSASSVSARPKRARQPPRRLDSPMTVTSITPPTARTTPTPAPEHMAIDDTAPPTRHANGHNLALSVPPPSSMHPSLRYKPLAPPAPAPEAPKKEKAAVAKPVTPKVPPPSAKPETTTPSSGLKIRLPRMAAIVKTEPPAEPEEPPAASRPKGAANGSRPRRSLRRQASVATSVTGTSMSAPPSPKAGANGTS